MIPLKDSRIFKHMLWRGILVLVFVRIHGCVYVSSKCAGIRNEVYRAEMNDL